MAEADEAERMMAAKREARAQARRKRTEGSGLQTRAISAPVAQDKTPRSRKRLSSSRLSSSGASPGVSRRSSTAGNVTDSKYEAIAAKHEAALQTVNQLEATKTAMFFELNKTKDRFDEVSEDLAEAQTSSRRYKAELLEKSLECQELLEKNNILEAAAAAAARGEPIIDLKPKVEELEAEVLKLTEALATAELEAQVANERTAATAGNSESKVLRLEAQIKRMEDDIRKAEEGEDEAKREVRSTNRDVRRLKTKIEDQEYELESLRDAYERLRQKLKRRDSNQPAWKPP